MANSIAAGAAPRGKREVTSGAEKPAGLPVIAESIPVELTARRQWVCWRWERVRAKWTKVPKRAGTLDSAKTNDPATWTTFAEAMDWHRRNPETTDGIGYVFTPDDPYCGVDLDDALDAKGELKPWSRRRVERLASYAEVSPSRTGVKLFVRGKWEDRKHRAVVGDGEVEVYDRLRYWTVTGNVLPGAPAAIMEAQDALDELHDDLFADKPKKATAEPRSAPVPLEDQDILDRAFRARNAQKFSALMDGDTSAYDGDNSRADMALCCMLAFWTQDAAQIDRLFRGSRLFRDKWDERHGRDGQTYGQLTVSRALQTVSETYSPGARRPSDAAGESGNPGEGGPPPAGGDGGACGGDGRGLPSIVANRRQLREITADALVAVERANCPPSLFQRGGLLVRLRRDPSTAIGALEEMDDAAVRGYLARAADWFEETTVKGDEIERPAAPPLVVVKDFMSLECWPCVPPVDAVVRTPVFGPDGSLVTTPGYHPSARLLYDPAPGLVVPGVPAWPTAQDVAEAKRLILDDLFGDFPFVDNASRAHAMAALLLPFLRQMVRGPTPLHLYDAPTEGTGKSLLTSVTAMVATGEDSPAVMAECGNNEEWEKRITALLISAPTMVMIDNVHKTLDSGPLAACFSSSRWTGRRLGFSETVTVPNNTCWLASGNNVRLSRELQRRTLWCRIDRKRADPWAWDQARHPNLQAWVRENRGRLVWAALVLCQAWVAAGRPEGKEKLGSFEAWVATLGGVLEVAGIPGLLANQNEFLRVSADTDGDWKEFVRLWRQKYQGDFVGTKDLFQLAVESNLLGDEMGPGNERSQRTKFGNALARRRDRVYGDHRVLAEKGDHSGRGLYRLERVEAERPAGAPPVPATDPAGLADLTEGGGGPDLADLTAGGDGERWEGEIPW